MTQREIDLKTMMEERKFTDQDGSESIFSVLVIDKPEKWLPANQHSHEFNIKTPGTNKVKRFNLNAISYSAWEDIEDSNPLPELKQDEYGNDNTSDPQFLEAHAKVHERRNILFIESSIGEKIPGTTPEEKIAWLNKRAAGEFQQLVSFVKNTMGAISEGNTIDQYNAVVINDVTSVNNVKEIKSLADWDEVDDSYGAFRISRPFEDYVVEFPIKAISSQTRSEIEKACIPPIPPKGPYVDPVTNKIDPRRIVPNTKDPHYIQKLNQVHYKKLLMLTQAALTFEIPGSTQDEKIKWLTDRIIGDIIKLRRFIDEELLGYKQQFDSFI